MRPYTFLAALLALMLTHHAARAQWLTNGNAVCTAADQQTSPALVADGNGGALILWRDHRDGFDWHVYSQRIGATGVALWAPDGVIASTLGGFPAAVADGAGGAITGFNGYGGATSFDEFVQRVGDDGVAQWGPNGINVCNAPLPQYSPVIVPDGSGGAVIAWEDERTGSSQDIYAQRINASGLAIWVSDGVALCSAPYNQSDVSLAPDGTGGVIVAWYDPRDNDPYDTDIYVQRVDGTGTVIWTTNGIRISDTPTNMQSDPCVVSDGAGGAIIVWADNQGSNFGDIYGQRIDAGGNVLWAADGVPICAVNFSTQWDQDVAMDGEGGAIVAWEDSRNGSTNPDIYMQRVDGSGASLWKPNGVEICIAADWQDTPALCRLAGGGALVAWRDKRNGATSDIYAQRVDDLGNITLAPDGVAICVAAGNQLTPAVVATGSNSAMVAWEDRRSGVADIYAFLVNDGSTVVGGALAPRMTLQPNYPNPLTHSTWVNFNLSKDSDVEIAIYDVAGRLRSRMREAGLLAGPHSIEIEARDRNGSLLPSGVYFYQVRTQAGESATRKMVIAR